MFAQCLKGSLEYGPSPMTKFQGFMKRQFIHNRNVITSYVHAIPTKLTDNYLALYSNLDV